MQMMNELESRMNETSDENKLPFAALIFGLLQTSRTQSSPDHSSLDIENTP
jgi:hypothetical protein